MTVAEELFARAFAEEKADQQKKTDVPPAEWRRSGRASKAWPEKETEEWWAENGPLMVQRWIDWRTSSGWTLWETPDGRPAVELALNVQMGGVPVKMFIDRVFVTPEGQLVVVDLKTGSREPKDPIQLGMYACGMELTFGERPQYGAYWMGRTGGTGVPHDLEHLTVDLMGGWLADWDRARRANLFIPHVTDMCGYCSVRDYCVAVNGPKWREAQ